MNSEETVKIKKLTNTTIFCVTRARIMVCLIISLIFWIVRLGLGPVNEAESEISRNSWGFHIGIVTILFGMVFVALGLRIIVNLLLKLSEQLMRQEENSTYIGAGEIKSIRIIVVRILMTLITIIMLAWASCTGYGLATKPRSEDKYYPLIFPIGVVTIVFGVVYIIIGLALIGDLALALTSQFLIKKKNGIVAQHDPNSEAKSFV